MVDGVPVAPIIRLTLSSLMSFLAQMHRLRLLSLRVARDQPDLHAADAAGLVDHRDPDLGAVQIGLGEFSQRTDLREHEADFEFRLSLARARCGGKHRCGEYRNHHAMSELHSILPARCAAFFVVPLPQNIRDMARRVHRSGLVSRFRSSPHVAACRYRKDTSKSMILAPLLNPKFAIGLAAQTCELRVWSTGAAATITAACDPRGPRGLLTPFPRSPWRYQRSDQACGAHRRQ